MRASKDQLELARQEQKAKRDHDRRIREMIRRKRYEGPIGVHCDMCGQPMHVGTVSEPRICSSCR